MENLYSASRTWKYGIQCVQISITSLSISKPTRINQTTGCRIKIKIMFSSAGLGDPWHRIKISNFFIWNIFSKPKYYIQKKNWPQFVFCHYLVTYKNFLKKNTYQKSNLTEIRTHRFWEHNSGHRNWNTCMSRHY